MIANKYQEAIFTAIKDTNNNLIIEACAGSGKTTTILQALDLVKGSALFLAFNKSIAVELQTKVPAHVTCKTLSAQGYALLRESTGMKFIVDDDKVRKIMDAYIPLQFHKTLRGDAYDAIKNARIAVDKIVGLIKSTLIDYTSAEAVFGLADYYAVEFLPNYMPYVKYVIEESNRIAENRGVIDFDDMVYLPVLRKYSPKYKIDTIFVDETQDLNRSQVELLLKLVSKSGRIICVGDSKQSIYGFRGADVNAMASVKEILNAVELPLSVCYRCPTSHINLAKSIVPQIEARHDAPEGEVLNIDEKVFVETLVAEDASKTLVLSRTNADLITYALKLISQGYKAVIKGRDIGSGLISLVRKFKKAETIADLQNFLDGWRIKEIENLTRRKHEGAIQGVEDKYECLCNVMNTCDSISDVVNKLEVLFSNNDVAGFTFSSIHRSKGLQAETVYILNPSKLPLRWKNMQLWEVEQENNIRYVAYTRSKNKLVFVKEPPKN